MEKNKSFTLIELLLVISIISLIVIIIISGMKTGIERSRIIKTLQYQSSLHGNIGTHTVAWWNFDQEAGDRSYARDMSMYNNNGTLHNFTGNYWVNGVPGAGGYALEFDGVNDRVHTADMSQFLDGNKVTFSAWVYRYESVNTNNMFMGQGSPLFAFRSSGIFYFMADIDGARNHLFGSSTYENNKWYYFVATFDGEYMTMYVNGEEDARINRPGEISLPYSTPFCIGDGRSSTWSPFKGIIDDVRIYNTALTSEEIKNIYAETKHKYLAEQNY